MASPVIAKLETNNNTWNWSWMHPRLNSVYTHCQKVLAVIINNIEPF